MPDEPDEQRDRSTDDPQRQATSRPAIRQRLIARRLFVRRTAWLLAAVLSFSVFAGALSYRTAPAPTGTWKTYPELRTSDIAQGTPAPPSLPRALRRDVGLAARNAGLAASSNVAGTNSTPPSPPLTEGQKADPALVPGCIGHTDNIDAHPGDVVIVDAAVVIGTCDPKLFTLASQVAPLGSSGSTATSTQASGGTLDNSLSNLPAKDPVDVLDSAGKAKLELLSPLFPGQISKISDELQDMKLQHKTGAWSWEVRPDRPGNYTMSLVLSIVDADGTEVDLVNRRIEVHMRVERSFSYTMGSIWGGLSSFLTSLGGLVVGLVGAIAAVAGLLPKLRKPTKSQGQAGAKSDDRNGYI